MELAGLKVVMDADFSAVEKGFAQMERMAVQFSDNIKNALSGVSSSDLASATAGSTNAMRENVAAQSEALKSAQQLEDQWRNSIGAINEVVAQNERYKAELATLKDEIKESTKANIESDGSMQSVSKRLVELRLREEELKVAIAENRQTIKAQSKEMNSAEGSMDAVNHKLGQMRDLYRQLSATERESDFGKQLQQQIQVLDKEIKSLDRSIGNHQRNVGNYASAYKPLSNSITQLTASLPAFSRGMEQGFSTVSSSALSVSNAIQHLKTRNAELMAQGKPVQSVFKAISGALFSWQTALGIGITLLATYGPKLYEMAVGTKGATEAKKRLKEEQDALNNTDKTAIKSAGEQIGKLRTLQATMTNTGLSMRQRTIAYQEAVKLYPAYLDSVSKDDALNGGLADTINKRLIPAIIAAAKARAFQEKINILTAKQIELEEEQVKTIRDRARAQDELNKVSERAGDNLTFGPQEANISPAFSRQLRQAANEVENLTEAQNRNASERVRIIKDIEDYASRVNSFTTQAGDLNPFKKEPAEKIAKGVKKIKEEIKTLPNAPFQKIAYDMTSLGNVATYTADQIEHMIERSNDVIRHNNISENLRQMIGDIASIIEDTLQKSFASVAETIGNMFSGGEFDFIGGILDVIGGQLKELGQYLIEVGLAREAIEKALASLNITGVGAIIAGGAAIALGTILQNAARKRTQTAFADGGVVYGPTNALVGEYSGARGNPEVIAPLDKLTSILREQNIGNSNAVPVVLDTRIQGQDLLLIHERAKKSFNR